MKDNFLISNDFFNENEEEESNSLFQFSKNALIQKEDSSFNYFNNLEELNEEEEEERMNSGNELNENDIKNSIFENDSQDKNNIFQEKSVFKIYAVRVYDSQAHVNGVVFFVRL